MRKRTIHHLLIQGGVIGFSAFVIATVFYFLAHFTNRIGYGNYVLVIQAIICIIVYFFHRVHLGLYLLFCICCSAVGFCIWAICEHTFLYRLLVFVR